MESINSAIAWLAKFGVQAGLGTILTLSLVSPALGEGVAQFGITQRLLDFNTSQNDGYASDANSASQFVDIAAAGEVINISVCGNANTDNIDIEIFDPTATSLAVIPLPHR